jgi:nickel-dependent lactate racemase
MKSPAQEKCKKFMFPYGEGEIKIEIPDRNSPKILRMAEPNALSNETKGLLEAIKNPIMCEPLTNLLRPDSEVALIVSDITRPVPNHKIIPCLLDELSKVPIPFKNVSIVVAVGMHRANTEVELRSMLGGEVYDKVRVINHNAFGSDNLTCFGETSYGTPLAINEIVAGADAIIATGYIEPHEFAGFTGGRKSILPGVSGIESIRKNHRPDMLDHPKAKIGTLKGNPIHEDMVEAARKVGLDFIVNVVLNSRKDIVKVFSGDFFDAHLKGVECYRRYATPDFEGRAEVVIASSGYPLDGDLYQSIKSVIAAEPFVKEDGYIILLAEIRDGLGPGAFGEWMRVITSLDEVEPRIRKKGFSPEIDHCYLLAKILRRTKLITVSQNPILNSIKFSDRLLITDSAEEALKIAFADVGRDAGVIGLPYAPRIVAKEY